jgi:hypothetical protein
MQSSLKYISKEKEEESKKRKVPTKLQGINERVSEVFFLINREISVILLLVERL